MEYRIHGRCISPSWLISGWQDLCLWDGQTSERHPASLDGAWSLMPMSSRCLMCATSARRWSMEKALHSIQGMVKNALKEQEGFYLQLYIYTYMHTHMRTCIHSCIHGIVNKVVNGMLSYFEDSADFTWGSLNSLRNKMIVSITLGIRLVWLFLQSEPFSVVSSDFRKLPNGTSLLKSCTGVSRCPAMRNRLRFHVSYLPFSSCSLR